ncbi:MAG: efflux RND transporter permease subunit [Rhodobacterales bacterium]|nr:efflux RND transporter permease subunit [Rhodobacterales bacterium]
MIRFFAAHATAGNLLMIGLMAIGLFAASAVKRETFPDIPAREIQVQIPYPGATAEEVEDAICRRVEDALDGINGLEEQRCEARESLAIAVAKMIEDTPADRFLDDVKTEIDAIDSFPDDAERPVVKELGRTDFVASVAISGPMAPPDLKAYAEALKDRIMRLPGVAQVSITGFSEHQIRIEVPATTLRQHGLSVEDLANVIARQSVTVPAGSIETRDSTVLIRFDDERRTPLQFADLVVVGADSGAEIRLGDIATITDRFELDESKYLYNGARAALLVVEKGKGDDTLDVVDELRAFLADEGHRAPPGVVLEVTHDISSIVRDRLNMLLRNGGQGLVLVFLCMWLFFNLRFSFWVAMGLPVSFLGTIAMMAMLGYSFDMITLVALLIAVGLLMDDAIVLSENIAAHRGRGAGVLEASVNGAREVAPGVISSFLTTICIFGGLAFISGNLGKIMGVLPVILIATLSVSLVEAFLILPHHLKGALEDFGHKPSSVRQRIEHGIDWVRENLVGRVVDRAVQFRYLTLGVCVGLIILSVAAIAGGALKFRPFPSVEGDTAQARILLPQGTPLEHTQQVIDKVIAALHRVDAEFAPRQPGGQSVIKAVGIEYGNNSEASETGAHVATVHLDLLSAEVRHARMDDVLNRWREETGVLPDVISLVFAKRQLGPAGRAIDIRLLGDDLDTLKAASRDLQDWLRSYKGVRDLTDDLRPGKPELSIHLRDGATALGLTAGDIASQLRSAFQGRKADEIQVGSESYEIDVRLAAFDRDTVSDLDYFTVTAPDGTQVPLDSVAVVDSDRGYARIQRIDGWRAVTIRGDVDTAVANTDLIIRDTRARFLPGLMQRYPGVRPDFEGETKEMGKSFASLGRNFILGLLGVFLILSFQFRSYVEPVVVMTAIPLGLIGVVGGHLALGLDLSMPSMVGMASLAGVVVNDSILLVRFIKLEAREGLTIAQAACQASRRRFRAILLTSLTTVAGLLPLLTETSLQAQVVIPLVTSLAFGLFAATVLLLFLVPAFYTILDDLGVAAHGVERPGTVPGKQAA